MAHVIAIAALGKNRELGKGNELLWTIPDDLKRFKQLTTGHPVIMGRKTFESILAVLRKPLPGRTNIVVTRDASSVATEGVIVATSVEEALKVAHESAGSDKVFICGGAQIYAAALPYTDRLSLTLIDDTKESDAYFPAFETAFTRSVYEELREHEGLKYRWVDLER